MRIEIRCVSYSEDTSEAIKQMDAVYGPTFVRIFGDGAVSQSFGDLVIFTSIMHPAAQRAPDNRRGSYYKPTHTYFSSCHLDYADWIPQDWRSRVLGYGQAIDTAIMRIAKTRLTDAERLVLLDVNARTITEVMASAPEFITPLKPVSLIYFESSDRAGLHFGPVPGANDFSPPGVRYVEVRPEDAFSIPTSQTKGEEALPAISRQFRRDEDGLHFYEAFPHEGRITEYEGLCGIGGENRFHDFETSAQAAKIVARLKSQMKAKGFRSVPMSKHKRLIVEYPVEGNCWSCPSEWCNWVRA
ncbi:hypothetical protein [Asticcacaulis sp. EMRT-3]|uniref:hypothetical protein n=1 Tax=Asticcacaulis sp. EMRT-3 TaxID=3040349 RepID=UPI0024AF0200|nr:hypothetical protein [Asticcacaulis sp. EMRT-3]MDI7776057.1 hypothetical protein [Asticcacaulis sp. EMRT-3]